jgi:hypothetical protein
MNTTLTPETQTETIARLRAAGWGPAKILAGLGHPGYGAAYARRVLASIEANGWSAHHVIYNGWGM